MRLGTLSVSFCYVVDLDDEAMVDHAKDALADDIQDCPPGRLGHTKPFITVESGILKEEDIPEFLMEEKRERESEERK